MAYVSRHTGLTDVARRSDETEVREEMMLVRIGSSSETGGGSLRTGRLTGSDLSFDGVS